MTTGRREAGGMARGLRDDKRLLCGKKEEKQERVGDKEGRGGGRTRRRGRGEEGENKAIPPPPVKTT